MGPLTRNIAIRGLIAPGYLLQRVVIDLFESIVHGMSRHDDTLVLHYLELNFAIPILLHCRIKVTKAKPFLYCWSFEDYKPVNSLTGVGEAGLVVGHHDEEGEKESLDPHKLK